MDWGLENRLYSIINPKTNRTVMLAVDHGYFLGPTTGLEKLGECITPLLPYADTLMLNRGMLRTSIDGKANIPIVLRVSGGSSVLGELSDEGVTCTMKDAIRLNVSGVALSIFVGSENEKQTLMNLSHLINEANEYNIPVVAVTAVGKEMGRDARYLALASRIAAELGAHIVKTYYCENFERVVDTCPVPIVIAGGKKIPEKDALEMAYNAVQTGAVGVDMGRNIFQAEAPVAMIQAVSAVVHKNTKPKEALEMYNDLKAKSGKKKGKKK